MEATSIEEGRCPFNDRLPRFFTFGHQSSSIPRIIFEPCVPRQESDA
ncbi:hypothetical protein [Terriglobus roseus]|nr:hypothetical protein [Terriglobus roseus]